MNASLSDSSQLLQTAERKARRFWVSLIVGLLGLQVVIGIASVILAISDPTAAVIKDYYQSAVNWDSTRRARQLTAQLGWDLDVSVGPVLPGGRERQLRLTVSSSDQMPVESLVVSASFFHHAKGSDVHQMRLVEVGEGVYVGTTTLTQSGLWQLELQIAGDHGLAEQTAELLVR